MSTAFASLDDIKNALKQCYDPEVPVNIWDLGLIYDVKLEPPRVYVKMTLTTRGCPAHSFLREKVRSELVKLPGMREAVVDIVWDPPWTPEKMNEEAKQRLGFIARPPPKLPAGLKPARVGRMVRKADGTILLVNGREEAFRVSEHESLVWSLCDGSRTVEELLEAVAAQLGVGSTVIRNELMQMVADFLDAGLVFQPVQIGIGPTV